MNSPHGGILRSLAAVAAVGILVSCAPRAPQFTDELVGNWQGSILIQNRTLGVVVHFEKNGTARMDILSTGSGESDGGTMSFALSNVRFRPPSIDFDLSAGSDLATFRGKITAGEIAGAFEQAGYKGSFALAKMGSGAVTAEAGIDVTLRTPTGDLHGSLLLPDDAAKGGAPPPAGYPLVLIISGQGAMDRDGNSRDNNAINNCLGLFASELAKRGFASVRYDRRGVGESAAALKPGAHLLFTNLTDDAAAWITNLRQDKRFAKIAVIGYGEGALVGMIAAQAAGADAFVSVAGPGKPADVLMEEQLLGQPRAIRDQALHIIDQLKAGHEVPSIPASLRALFESEEQSFLISKFRFDPAKEIAKLTMPVLIIQGTSDLQVNASQAELLHAANPRSYLDLIRGMNHVLRAVSSDTTANLASYSNPDLPIDSELIQVTYEFLRQTLGLIAPA